MRRSFRLVVGLGLVLGAAAMAAPPARAQATDGEGELAEALTRVKFYDLAEFLYKRAIERGTTPAAKASGELGLIKLKKAQAEEERDPETQKKIFDEAIAALEELLKKAAGGASAEAKFQLADLLTSKGQKLIEQMNRTDDPAVKENLRRDAQGVYTQVADLFKAVVDALKEPYEKAKNEEGDIDRTKFPEARENELTKGWFLQGEAYYNRGRIAVDKREREKDLKQALEILNEFAWEFEDQLVGLWAYITIAQCNAELRRFGDAQERLKAILDQDANDPRFDGIRMTAFWRAAEAMVLDGKMTEAIAVIDRMQKEYPKQYLDTEAGQSALLEKGKALAAQQQYGAAIAEALRVVNAPNPWKKASALALLAGWGSLDTSAGAKIAFLQGEGFYGQYRSTGKPEFLYQAITAYQEAATRIQTDEERKEYGVKVWRQVGLAFGEAERYYEAGIAFERGARVKGADPIAAGWCAFNAYLAYSSRYKQLTPPDEFDKRLYRDARSFFTSTFPDDPLKGNIPYYEAKDLEDDGKYLEAAAAYERLDPKSQLSEMALARAGNCFIREFQRKAREAEAKGQKPNPSDRTLLDQGEAKLKAFLAKVKDAPKIMSAPGEVDLQAQGQREAATGLSIYYLATIAEARGEDTKVLELLAGFAEPYKDQRPLVSNAFYMEVRALERLKRVDDTVKKLDELVAFNPGFGNLGVAKQVVGKMLEADAKALVNAGKLAEGAARKVQSARLLADWIKTDTKARAKSDNLLGVALPVKQAADEERTAGRKVESVELYAVGAELYDLAMKNAAKMKIEAKTLENIELILSECQVSVAELQDEQDKTAEGTKAWGEALPLLERLYAKKPKNREIINRLAKAFERTNQLEKALDLFTKLVTRAFKQFTSEWWEAKYWQLEIQLRMGKKDTVGQLLDNLRLLVPELGGDEMKARFKDLAKRAGKIAGWE